MADGDNILIDGVAIPYYNFDLVRLVGVDQADGLSFECPSKVPVAENQFVKVVSASGKTKYLGVIVGTEGDILSGKKKISCAHVTGLPSVRVAAPIRYGAAPVTDDSYDQLTVEEVLSSDSPVQSGGGPEEFIPGLIWAMNSAVPKGLESVDAGGIWTIEGFGSKFSSGDVYFDGVECSEVESAGAVDDDDFQFYRTVEDILIYGEGAGDKWGTAYIENAFDSRLRLGDLDRGDEFHLAALDVDVEYFYPLIWDYIKAQGMYPSYHHAGDYVYIDGGINPPGRGDSGGGFVTLRRGTRDIVGPVSKLAPSEPIPTAVLGAGAGSGPTMERAAYADLSKRGPWIERLQEISGGYRAPLGLLEQQTYNVWEEANFRDRFELDTSIGYIEAGDWINLCLGKDGFHTVLVREVREGPGPLLSLKCGGPDADVMNAYLSAISSPAVTKYVTGAHHGSQTGSDSLGYTETFTMQWTGANIVNKDTALLTFSLSVSEADPSDQQNLSVTYTVTVNGTVVAVLRNRPWGGEDVISKLNITDACNLDGSTETLTVTVSDPTSTLDENLTHVGVVDGIGRYGQSAAVIMYPSSVESSGLGYTGSTEIATIAADNSRYVYPDATTSGRYQLQDVGVPGWDNWKVTVYFKGHRSYTICTMPSCGASIRPFIYTHSTFYYGTARSLSFSVSQYEQSWNTNPYTGSAWTQQEITDLQVGVVLSNGYDGEYGMVSQARCNLLRVDLR